MFSRIVDMLKVHPYAQDGRDKEGSAHGQPQGGSGKKKDGGLSLFESGDSVLLSLDALRAIAKTQNLADEDERRFEAALSRLAGHGLSRIPLRPGQSAAEAVTEALSFLSSSRG